MQRFGILWERAKAGYVVVGATDTAGRSIEVLADRASTHGLTGRSIPVDPFEDSGAKPKSGLFRTFAELHRQPDHISEFADDYGLLGVDGAVVLIAGSEVRCETIDEWRIQSGAMSAMVALWDGLQAGDREQIARALRDVPEDYFDGAETLSEQWDALAVGVGVHLYGPARWGPVGSPVVMSGVIVKAARSRGSGPGIELQMQPSSLLSALWLQFALAIEGNKEFRACASCGTWFELTPTEARTNRVYCTGACRSRAYRRRSAIRED